MQDDLVARLLAKLEHLEREIAGLKETTLAVRQLVGPFAATFPDGSMLTQTLHGVKYFIDPEDLVIAPQMVIYRQWEADLSALFRQFCTRDSVVIDVGANFGYFTCLAATLIGPGGAGKVFAFEPNPKLAALLRRNMEINWSMAPVMLHEAAVADFDGRVVLHIPREHGANASLSPPELANVDTVDVKSVRLDDIIPSDVAVDILKIDVEGHELGVLEGARALIARSPAIKVIMEWSRSQMALAGVDPERIVDHFTGFHCYRVELNQDPFENRESIEWLLAQDYVDVIFCRQ